MAAALGAGGGAGAADDDFDQFDKPGAERSWRRRAADEDWDSELEDDLLGEDLLSGKKTREEEGRAERRRNIHQFPPIYTATRDRTQNLSVYRMMLQPTEPPD